MMHRCSSSQGNMVGPCSCGLFHSQSNSFSMLFSMPNHKSFDETDMYPYMSPSSSSLLLLTALSHWGPPPLVYAKTTRKGCAMNDFLVLACQTFAGICYRQKNAPYAPQTNKTSRGGNGSGNSNSGNDPLLARRCANCDTTSTPLWRNGPRGPKSLCNACGIRFKKEERRATAANANSTSASSSGVMEQHQAYYNSPWVQHTQTQKMACFSPAANEFRFIEDSDQNSDTGIPFLSWRLNVTDRPSLVHDFTR